MKQNSSTSINSGNNTSSYLPLDGNKTNNTNKEVIISKNKWCCCQLPIPITGRLESKCLTGVLIVFLIDLLSNIYLLFSTHNNSLNNVDLHGDLTAFHDGTSDTILLWILRFILLLTLTICAIKKGVPIELWNKHKTIEKLEILTAIDDHDKNNVNDIELDMQSNENPQKAKAKEDEDEFEDSVEGIDDYRKFQPKFDNKTDSENYDFRRKRSSIYKYIILLIMFLLTTTFQSYIGVKSIVFNFNDNIISQAICFGISIICINCEIFLLKTIIESATNTGNNIMVYSLHLHPLQYENGKNYHCDLCCKSNDEVYRCKKCNYDVCKDCFKKEKKKLIKKEKNKKNGIKSDDNDNDIDEFDGKRLTSSFYIRRCIELCKPHSLIVLFGCISLILASISSLLSPKLQGKIFDEIISSNKSEFLLLIKYYLIVSIFNGLFSSLNQMFFQFFWQRLTTSIRMKLFSNITIQDIEFFDNTSTGELLARLGNDVWRMTDPLYTILRSSLSNIILLFGGLIMCFFTSWRLSMLAFTTLAPILYLTSEYAKWSKNIWSRVWGSFGKSSSIAQQTFANIRTVRAFGTELKEINKYNKSLHAMLKAGILVNCGEIVRSFCTSYLELGASILLIYFGGMALFNSDKIHTELTVGKLITFQLYWNMMTNSFKGLTNILESFTKGISAGERVLTILDRMSKHRNNLYNGIECVLDGNIYIDNVNFTYNSRPNEPVLRGINLHIKPNEVVAIVGKSGGGKTTLIHLLMRFYDIKDGAIYYNSNKLSLNKMNLTSLRHQIGFVGQDTETFDTTVRKNITYGICDDDGNERDDITLKEIIHYSKLANCHEFVEKFDESYETRVGERGVKLSGGQKQRLAIARMLIKRPKILLLDEATSNLDTESEALVQAAIDKTIWFDNDNDDKKYDDNNDNKYELFKANAVILIAHRLSTVINADKIAVIDNGCIVELGNHNQLLNIKNGVYKKLVQRQMQKEKNQLNLKKDDDNELDNANDNIDNLFDP